MIVESTNFSTTSTCAAKSAAAQLQQPLAHARHRLSTETQLSPSVLSGHHRAYTVRVHPVSFAPPARRPTKRCGVSGAQPQVPHPWMALSAPSAFLRRRLMSPLKPVDAPTASSKRAERQACWCRDASLVRASREDPSLETDVPHVTLPSCETQVRHHRRHPRAHVHLIATRLMRTFVYPKTSWSRTRTMHTWSSLRGRV